MIARFCSELWIVLPVDVIVDLVDRPAMLARKIDQLGKRRVLKTEACAGIIRLRGNAHDGVHDLIQQSAM